MSVEVMNEFITDVTKDVLGQRIARGDKPEEVLTVGRSCARLAIKNVLQELGIDEKKLVEIKGVE